MAFSPPSAADRWDLTHMYINLPIILARARFWTKEQFFSTLFIQFSFVVLFWLNVHSLVFAISRVCVSVAFMSCWSIHPLPHTCLFFSVVTVLALPSSFMFIKFELYLPPSDLFQFNWSQSWNQSKRLAVLTRDALRIDWAEHGRWPRARSVLLRSTLIHFDIDVQQVFSQ